MDFQEIVNNSYFAAKTTNKWKESKELREVYNYAFQRGAQWSAKTSSQLAPHIADFCEFMVWLTAIDMPEVNAEAENVNNLATDSQPPTTGSR